MRWLMWLRCLDDSGNMLLQEQFEQRAPSEHTALLAACERIATRYSIPAGCVQLVLTVIGRSKP